MRDEPHGVGAGRAEQGELDTLRERAYGPEADIADDPAAIARLELLEEQMGSSKISTPEVETDASTGSATEPDSMSTAVEGAWTDSVAPAGAPRWHSALIGATAIAALLMGATAFSASRVTEPQAAAPIVSVPDGIWATSSEPGYDLFLDHLRDELLERPGMEDIGSRLIRDQLRPYGSIYGRSVWAGSTTNGQYCMIVVDSPEPSVGCISIDEAYASALSIILPAVSDPDAGAITAGEPVAYTLLPGGDVVAAPAASPVPTP